MKILASVKYEADRVDKIMQRPYASAHEFYGVLMEEVEELWEEIKKKEEKRDVEHMKKEAIQCMSVLYRFVKSL